MKDHLRLIQASLGDGRPYDTLAGDTPFAVAVNKVLSEHWIETGKEMFVLDAIVVVLATDFNGRYPGHDPHPPS